MTKRLIEINADYRLAIDTDNIQIERLITVDPTRTVGYDPEKHGTEIRQEWRSIGKYYGTIPAALEGVLSHALRSGLDTDIRGLLVEFQSFRDELTALWRSTI